MKTASKKLLLLVLSAVCGWTIAAAEQITFNVIPTSVSNTYTGFITLQIAGLTNGEAVIFHDYLDVNSNGVVDPGEPFLNAFRLTNGGASVFGGITNLSVPYDSNPATDTITTTLNFAATLDNLVGRRIFQIVSPTANFTATNFSFIVTNSTLSQSVSGNVFVNGSTPMPKAVVVALSLPDQNYAFGTVADNSGHYFLPLTPGTYGLLAAFQNTFVDESLLPTVILASGQSSTNNLSITNGTVALSGTVIDAGNSNALAGVFLQFESGNLFSVAFTDTNGNFTNLVNPGQWKIKGDSESMTRRGYVVTDGGISENTSGGAVSNISVSFHQGNALFYGSVLGPTGSPLTNFHIAASTDTGSVSQFKSDVYTDQNGNYGAVAFVTTNNAANTNFWNCSAGSNPSFSSLLFTIGIDTNLSSNQAVKVNFNSVAGTATISGNLHDSSGNPLYAVNIYGNTLINGTNFGDLGSQTDFNGNFSIAALANTEWQVSADCCDQNGLSNFGDYDPTFHNLFVTSSAYVNITAYPDNTPVLSNPQIFPPASFEFQLSAPPNPPGSHYTVFATTNLSLPFSKWITVLTTNFTGFSTIIFDTNAAGPRRFYSVSVGP